MKRLKSVYFYCFQAFHQGDEVGGVRPLAEFHLGETILCTNQLLYYTAATHRAVELI